MTGPRNREELPVEVQGAIAMARYWRYEHPDEEIPDREARYMVKGLLVLARTLEGSRNRETPE